MGTPWSWPVDPAPIPVSQQEEERARCAGEPARRRPVPREPVPSPYYPPRVGRHELSTPRPVPPRGPVR